MHHRLTQTYRSTSAQRVVGASVFYALQSSFILFLVAVFSGSVVAAEKRPAVLPPLTSVDFAPDGSVVATSQVGVHVYSWPELKRQQTINTKAANLHRIRFAPDGRHFAVAGGNPAEDGTIEIFSWPGGVSQTLFNGHADSVRSLVWADDSTIVAASVDRQVTIWKLSEPDKPTTTLNGHSRAVNAVCLLADRKTLVTAGVDQSLRVWNVETGELVRSMNQHTRPVHSVARRPTENGLPMIASSAADRTIRFWQPTIGRMVRYVRLDSPALDIAWLPDVERIAAGCSDGKVRIIDALQVKVLQTIDGIEGWIYAVAIHPQDSSVVIAGSNGRIKKLQIDTER